MPLRAACAYEECVDRPIAREIVRECLMRGIAFSTCHRIQPIRITESSKGQTMTKTFVIAAITAIIVAAGPNVAHAAPNLIINGGFDGVLAYSNTNTPVYEGLHYYDLGGAGNNGNVAVGEGITQTVATALGSAYQLTFGFSGENVTGAGPETLRVTVGGSTFDFVLNVDGTGVFQRAFTTQTLNYVATGSTTAISFTLASAPNGSGNNDPMIDGVIFALQSAATTGVPEPEPLALLALGLLAMLGARRCNKAIVRR
jgi:hypothetical protein